MGCRNKMRSVSEPVSLSGFCCFPSTHSASIYESFLVSNSASVYWRRGWPECRFGFCLFRSDGMQEKEGLSTRQCRSVHQVKFSLCNCSLGEKCGAVAKFEIRELASQRVNLRNETKRWISHISLLLLALWTLISVSFRAVMWLMALEKNKMTEFCEWKSMIKATAVTAGSKFFLCNL